MKYTLTWILEESTSSWPSKSYDWTQWIMY